MSVTTHAAEGLGTFDGGVLAGVVVAGIVYAVGAARLRATASGRRALPWPRVVALFAAWLALVVGLAPPIATAADVRFAAHMGQHELFLLVAPPLFVLGRPMLVGLWALPERWRIRVGRVLRRPGAARAWHLLTLPVVAFGAHAAVLWLWHVVPAFELALHHDAVHLVQHATFFASAALFWWALLHGRFGRLGYGAAVLFVFATALHSGALGALLAVSTRPWYPTHASRAAAQGVPALADQQLGGLLMWIPAGVLLLVLGLALFAAWLGESRRRVEATSLGVLCLVGLMTPGCRPRGETWPLPGDAERGRAAVVAYGCVACHRIPGVPSARSRVGPSLEDLPLRMSIAGKLPNTPDNLMMWIQHPQAVEPGNVMPDLGVTDADARDMSAFLLSR